MIEMASREKDGQGDEDYGRDATFGAEGVDLAPDLTPLSDGLGERVEHLGQVASHLALDPDGLRHPEHVVAVHPAGESGQ
jgi:hypothetical protein